MGAKPGEAGDDVPHGEVRNAARRRLCHAAQACRCGGGAVLVVLILRRGAHQQVAVDGGGHQHALAHGGGELEDGVLHQLTVPPVQQAVFAPAGNDGQLRLAQLVMERVAVYTGGGDDHPALQYALRRLQQEVIVLPADTLHLRVEAELAAVGGGVLRQRDGHAKGADNGAGRRIQRGHSLRRDPGLLTAQRLAAQHRQTFHAVALSAGFQFLQTGDVSLVKAQHQRAAPAVGEIQLVGQRLHHLGTSHIEPGLGRADGRVEPGVADGGVGLAGACTYILATLHQTDTQLIAAEPAGHGAANSAAAHDHSIIHRSNLFPEGGGQPLPATFSYTTL